VDQCLPNLQFDNLLKILKQEKEVASKKYFEKLFSQSKDKQVAPSVSEGEKRTKFSPVESLFQKHMRKSLAEFNAYLTTLTDKKELSLTQIRDVYIDKMGKAKTAVENRFPRGEAPRSAVDEALKPLEEQMNAEVAKVEDSFDQSVSLMLEAFDKVRRRRRNKEEKKMCFNHLFIILAFGDCDSIDFAAARVGDDCD
jgi:hypothetical protein